MLRSRGASLLAILSFASVASAQTKRPMSFADVMEIKNLGTVALAPDVGDRLLGERMGASQRASEY